MTTMLESMERAIERIEVIDLEMGREEVE